MEGVLHGNNLMTCLAVSVVSIAKRRLHRALNRLRTAVAEECFAAWNAGRLHQLLRCLYGRLAVKVIRDMNDLIDLSLDRVIKFLIIITQSEYCDSGKEIQIFLSFRIIQIYAVTMIQCQRIAVIGVKQVLLALLNNIFRLLIHDVPPQNDRW